MRTFVRLYFPHITIFFNFIAFERFFQGISFCSSGFVWKSFAFLKVVGFLPFSIGSVDHRDYKRIERAFRSKSRDKLKHLMGAKSRSLIG